MISKQIRHFENLLNWKLCKYLHLCQNAIPTISTFPAILKLHKYKTNLSVKKIMKALHLEI